MADQFLLPLPQFPQIPANLPPEVAQWAKAFQDAQRDNYFVLANRLQDLVISLPIADQPAANGTLRFFFATDTNTLYFDDGTWNAI
jgi:hypothetical protein